MTRSSTRRPLPPLDADRLVVERSPEPPSVAGLSLSPGITGPVALGCFSLMGGGLTLGSLAVPGWDGVDVQAALTAARR